MKRLPEDLIIALATAHKAPWAIQIQMPPVTAMYVAGALQLALRHPGIGETGTAVHIRQVCDAIAQQLGELGGEVLRDAVEMGFNSAYDTGRETGDGAPVSEGAYAIYAAGDDQPMAFWGRPQDFAFPHWHYRKLGLTVGEGGPTFILHAYIDIEPEGESDWMRWFGSLITHLPVPISGRPPDPLSPSDCLREDDFWPEGKPGRPPLCPDAEDWLDYQEVP